MLKVLIGLVVGLIVGGVAGGALIGGGAAGLGIATGLGAGICSTVQAAQEEGIMTAEQVDQVLNRAATDMAAMSSLESPSAIVGSAAECEGVLEKLRSAATDS